MSPGQPPIDELRALARAAHDARRLRDEVFGRDKALLGEPAWDLLLDLFARGEGRHTSVLAGCIGAATPTSTALRRIGRLEAAGLVRRDRDTNDARRTWLTITIQGEALMSEVLGKSRVQVAPGAELRCRR